MSRFAGPRLVAGLAAGAVVAVLASGCGVGAESPADGRDDTTASGPSRTATAARDHLTIYASLAFQGLSRPSADSVFNSAQLALEQAHGRAGGLPVQLVALDDSLGSTGATDAATVAQNAREAVRDPTAIAYLGDQGSGDTAVSLPITNRGGLLQVSPTNTSPGLTQTGGPDRFEPGKYYPTGMRTFGRLVPTDKIQGLAQAQLLRQLGCRATTLLQDDGLFGRGLAAQVRSAAARQRVTISRPSTVDATTGATAAVLAAVASRAPDCIVYAGAAGPKVVTLWTRLHSELPATKLIGPDSLANAEFALGVGTAGAVTYLTTPTIATKYFNDAGQDYLAAYAARFGGTPDPSGVYGYESMRAILASIDAAGTSPSRAAVVRQFFGLRNRASALGRYSITSTGDSTIRTFGASRVIDGSLVFDRVLDGGPGGDDADG